MDEAGVSVLEIPTTPITPDTPLQPPIVCDPLSSEMGCGPTGSTGGLIGNLYYYPNGDNVNAYITKGAKQDVLIKMTHLNIPLRGWTDGFPGPSGLLQDRMGQTLNEWFALDLKGFFLIPTGMGGQKYEFAIASDDGAILDLDNKVVVDNDGTHAIKWACSASAVLLEEGKKLPIRVRYYQGPRFEIALQVFMRPISKSALPCNSTGGWDLLPAESLSH